MNFRIHAMSAALLLAIAIPVAAQEPKDMREGERTPRAPGVDAALRLKSELKLSDAQVMQLEALRKEIVAEQEAMRKAAQERRERFQQILTEDQRAQLREQAQNWKMERRGDKRRPGRPPRAPRAPGFQN